MGQYFLDRQYMKNYELDQLTLIVLGACVLTITLL